LVWFLAVNWRVLAGRFKAIASPKGLLSSALRVFLA
jgi:hypothetical protein